MTDDLPTVCPWCLAVDPFLTVLDSAAVIAAICGYHLASLAARAGIDPRRLRPTEVSNGSVSTLPAPAHPNQPDGSDVSASAGGVALLGNPLAGLVAGDSTPAAPVWQRSTRYRRGEQHGRSKLTQAQATAIRAAYAAGTVGQRGLARTYGVSVSTIAAIVTGRTWTEAAS